MLSKTSTLEIEREVTQDKYERIQFKIHFFVDNSLDSSPEYSPYVFCELFVDRKLYNVFASERTGNAHTKT